MYAGGDSQMNGDMPHDGGHGGGGHAVGEELQKTGRYVTLTAINTSAWTRNIGPKDKRCGIKKGKLHEISILRVLNAASNKTSSASLPSGFVGACYLTSKEKRLSSSVTSPTRFTFRPCRPSCLFTWAP